MNSSNSNKKRKHQTPVNRPNKRQRTGSGGIEKVNETNIAPIASIEDESDELQSEYESKVKKYIENDKIKEIDFQNYNMPKQDEKFGRKARTLRNKLQSDIKQAINDQILFNKCSLLEAAVLVDRQIRHLDNKCNSKNEALPPPSITEIFHQPTPILSKQIQKKHAALKQEQNKYRIKPTALQTYKSDGGTKRVWVQKVAMLQIGEK